MGFLIIIIFMVLFGAFIQYAFMEINTLSAERQKLNEIQALVVKVKSDALNYKTTEDRQYIYAVSDSIDAIESIQKASQFNKLSKDLDLKILLIVEELVAFKEVLDNYMVLNDQLFALNIRIMNTTTEMTELLGTQENIADSMTFKTYIEAVDVLVRLNQASQDIKSNPLGQTAIYKKNITRLEHISKQLILSGKGIEANLLGNRMKSLALQHSEFYQKAVNHNREESDFEYNLLQLTAHLDAIVEQTMSSEQVAFQEKNKTLIYLSVFLLSLFIVVASYTSFSVSSRVRNSFDQLIEATTLISIGEYKERMTLTGDKDMERLAIGINEMATKLEGSRMSLESYNVRLLHMVEEKTKELNDANLELETINENLMAEKERLALAAMTDYLTQLKNRGYLVEFLRQRILEAKRYDKPFSVLLLDVDRFKLVNDTYGHQEGDRVLKTIAKILLSEIRQSDVAGRYGGEEFLVILTDTPLREALFVAERIRIGIEAYPHENKALAITISGGLMMYRGETEDELLKKVDALLYEAKDKGRNCIISDDI
jgi:diguanylate cyclase (GGDEF)-like protein